jgi:hypothetical protein
MVEMYMEEAEAPMFLSGFFRSPPRNFHTSEKVEIDIIRDEPDIAIVIVDLSTGARMNENNKYVNKAFTPPVLNEAGAITAYDMIKRRPGFDPFQDPDFGAAAAEQAFGIIRKLERKIRRTVELQASQVLATGAVTLIDSSGTTVYTIDFLAKSSHKATVGTAWATDGSTGTPLADLGALARTVRRDGKVKPNVLVFGSSAWIRFLANAAVQKMFIDNNNSPNIGTIAPETRGEGATFMGFIWIENYRFECWTYDAFYKHPQTGTLTDFVASDHVLMLSRQSRLDLSYGAIPLLRQPDSAVMTFLPPRMSSSDRGLDLSVNAYFTPNNKSLIVEAGTRPLAIPTAIDTFARLDVVP